MCDEGISLVILLSFDFLHLIVHFMCSDFSSSNDGDSVSLLIVRVQYMLNTVEVGINVEA